MHKYTHAHMDIYMYTHIHTPAYLRNHPKSIPFLVSSKHTMLLNTCYGFVRVMDWKRKININWHVTLLQCIFHEVRKKMVIIRKEKHYEKV